MSLLPNIGTGQLVSSGYVAENTTKLGNKPKELESIAVVSLPEVNESEREHRMKKSGSRDPFTTAEEGEKKRQEDGRSKRPKKPRRRRKNQHKISEEEINFRKDLNNNRTRVLNDSSLEKKGGNHDASQKWQYIAPETANVSNTQRNGETNAGGGKRVALSPIQPDNELQSSRKSVGRKGGRIPGKQRQQKVSQEPRINNWTGGRDGGGGRDVGGDGDGSLETSGYSSQSNSSGHSSQEIQRGVVKDSNRRPPGGRHGMQDDVTGPGSREPRDDNGHVFHATKDRSGTNDDVLIKTRPPPSEQKQQPVSNGPVTNPYKKHTRTTRPQQNGGPKLEKEDSNTRRQQSLPTRKEHPMVPNPPRNANSVPSSPKGEREVPMPTVNTLMAGELQKTAEALVQAHRNEPPPAKVRNGPESQRTAAKDNHRGKVPATVVPTATDIPSLGRISALSEDDTGQDDDRHVFPNRKQTDANQFQYYASPRRAGTNANNANPPIQNGDLHLDLEEKVPVKKKTREVTVVDPRALQNDDNDVSFPEEYHYIHSDSEDEATRIKTLAEMDEDERFEYFRQHTRLPPEQIRELTFHPKVNESKVIKKTYTGMDTINRGMSFSGSSPRDGTGRTHRSKKTTPVYKKVKSVVPYKRSSYMLNRLQTTMYTQINNVYGASPRETREKQFYAKLAEVQLNDYRDRYERLEAKERQKLEQKFRQRDQLRRLRRKFEKDAWRRFMTQYVTSRVLDSEYNDRTDYGLPNTLERDIEYDYVTKRKSMKKKFEDINPEDKLNKTKRKFKNMFNYNMGPTWDSRGKPIKMEGIDAVYLDSEDEQDLAAKAEKGVQPLFVKRNRVKKRQNVNALMREAEALLNQTDNDDTDAESSQKENRKQPYRTRPRLEDTRRERPVRHRQRSYNPDEEEKKKERNRPPPRREALSLPALGKKRYRTSEFVSDILSQTNKTYSQGTQSHNTTLQSVSTNGSSKKKVEFSPSDVSVTHSNVSRENSEKKKVKEQPKPAIHAKESRPPRSPENHRERRSVVQRKTFEEVVTLVGSDQGAITPLVTNEPTPKSPEYEKRDSPTKGRSQDTPVSKTNISPKASANAAASSPKQSRGSVPSEKQNGSVHTLARGSIHSDNQPGSVHNLPRGSVPSEKQSGSVHTLPRGTVPTEKQNGSVHTLARGSIPSEKQSARDSLPVVTDRSQSRNNAHGSRVDIEAHLPQVSDFPKRGTKQGAQTGQDTTTTKHVTTEIHTVVTTKTTQRTITPEPVVVARPSHGINQQTRSSDTVRSKPAEDKALTRPVQSGHSSVGSRYTNPVSIANPDSVKLSSKAEQYQQKRREKDAQAKSEYTPDRRETRVSKAVTYDEKTVTYVNPVSYEQRRKPITSLGQDATKKKPSHGRASDPRTKPGQSERTRPQQGMVNGHGGRDDRRKAKDNYKRRATYPNIHVAQEPREPKKPKDKPLPEIGVEGSRQQLHTKRQKSSHKKLHRTASERSRGKGSRGKRSQSDTEDDPALGGNKWKDLVQKYLRQPSIVAGKTEDRKILDDDLESDDDNSDIFERAMKRYDLDLEDDD